MSDYNVLGDGKKIIQNKSELKKIFDNNDENYYINYYKYSYPALFVIWKFATSYGYIWDMIIRPVQSNIEIEIKNSKVSDALNIASVAALAIPAIGEVIAVISAIAGNINLNVYGEISESGTSKTKLINHTDSLQNYAIPLNNVEPPTKLINWMIGLNSTGKAGNQTITKLPSIPKCVSPTDNCVLEHERYQKMCDVVIESQNTLLGIYQNYVQGDDFNSFQSTFYVDESEQTGTNIINSKNSKTALAGLGLIGLLAFISTRG